ncbi:MAG TPA: polymorphic toxin-type HINT domain-containing protein [Pirellulales bacterium]|jgi:hypothetical protein
MRLSRMVRHGAAFSLLVVALSALARGADRAQSSAAKTDDSTSPAAKLVREALEAETVGDAERRAAYLADALKADPDYAPAHWHSGEVRVGKAWQTVEASADAATRAGKVAQYRVKRDHVANTALGQIALAQWCASTGLNDEERTHLIFATQLQPTKKQSNEIIRKLGLVRRNGVLMTAAESENIAAEQVCSHHDFNQWKKRFSDLQNELNFRKSSRADALVRLRSIRDPEAIPALEAAFATSDEEVGGAVIDALAAMQEQKAAESLIRFAVFAGQDSVRQAAATALGQRSPYAYVPTLIATLEAPVQVEFQTDFSRGFAWHRLVLFQEGPLVDQRFVRIDAAHEEIVYSRNRQSFMRSQIVDDKTVHDDAARAEAELTANADRNRLNISITTALRTATGKELGDDFKLWWDWWLNENEIYQSPYKQVYEKTSIDTSPVRIKYVSCFPAGTPVETSTGSLPIEQIKPGDCVLTQEPDTGELAYKPVMAVTLRPASPLIEVRTAKETIRATRGHPFWVSGIGWQMAKELKAGQWLHTTAGPVQIESAEQQGEAECHNLVVADFNSYFVGQQRILVHDNNLRQVTTASVPGLVSD